MLITYQASVQHCWHDQLKQEGDGGFNIALIELGLLEIILNKIWDAVHAENKREVSSPPHFLQLHHAKAAHPNLLHILNLFPHATSCSCQTGTLFPCYTYLCYTCPCYTCFSAMLIMCATPCHSYTLPSWLACYTPLHPFSTQLIAFWPSTRCLVKYTILALPSPLFSLSLLYLHDMYSYLCTLAYVTDAKHS